MSRRLPPLTSLRAFEAAGRHLSFTKAASELTVTQAAISHQVKSLEEHLGTPLFLRQPRRLELTRAGKTLLPVVRRAFNQIGDAVAGIANAASSAELTVRLAPSFAAKWLSPRLDDFRRRHPNISLSLTHSNKATNFRRESIDVAVTYGTGKWPGAVAEEVLRLDFYPVCAPQLEQAQFPLDTVANLRHYTLLHDADHQNWADWLKLADAVDVDASRGTVMDDTNVLIQAAIDGLGVALCSTHFVAGELAAGRLVRPFDTVLHTDYAYYIVCPRKHLNRPEVLAFRDWLLTQSANDERLP